jgi:hypothetical protein
MTDPPLPPSAETEIRALLQQRRKIDAIKLLREHTGIGLKEAKDRIDALDRELRPADRATGPSGSGGLIVGALVCILAVLAWWWLTR